MDGIPVSNDVRGNPTTAKDMVLEGAAGMVQPLRPLGNVCAHLNAFHAYAHDPERYVEANHYCGHLNSDVRQCLLYDTPDKNARLIGIEYMIKPHLYEQLEPEEKKLWHSHVYEVKSGELIMPKPDLVPAAAWEAAEHEEMKTVIELYGKAYHLWQVDRGDKLPLGEPALVTSFVASWPQREKAIADRDARFNNDTAKKAEGRQDIADHPIHHEADQTWKGGFK